MRADAEGTLAGYMATQQVWTVVRGRRGHRSPWFGGLRETPEFTQIGDSGWSGRKERGNPVSTYYADLW